jgi:hypothetical protein
VEYAQDATVTSALSGQVNEAPLAFEAESGRVDLGSATVATATAPRRITFANTGHRVVHPGSASLIGQDSGSYTVTADTCTNAAVAPAGRCSFAVSVTPAAVGVTSATLRVAYDADSGAVDVGLTGTGLAKQEGGDGVKIEQPIDSSGNVVDPSGSKTQGPGAPTVLPLKLNKVRAPVRCLTYGTATPKKSIALKTNAKATVSWAIKKARGSKALFKCPHAPNSLQHAATSGATKGSGAIETDATGSAHVKLATLLPAKVRKAMKPGLYRVTFVARDVTGVSPERVVLIRVLKQRR